MPWSLSAASARKAFRSDPFGTSTSTSMSSSSRADMLSRSRLPRPRGDGPWTAADFFPLAQAFDTLVLKAEWLQNTGS